MKTLGIIVVVIIVAALGFYFYQGDGVNPYSTRDDSEETMDDEGTMEDENMMSDDGDAMMEGDDGAMMEGKEVIVNMTSSGFSPSTMTVKVGYTVKFVNTDTKNHWPASAVHPTHQVLPGFDSLGAVKPGESYSYTFEKAGQWGMHDHMNPSNTGKITVE
jgi:plastocyanin